MDRVPLVSVCVICFNSAAYLAECIESVLAQTFANIEIVFCDDASTDGSRELFESIISQHERKTRVVRVYRPTNGGAEQNMLDGIAAATGEYICNVDADDMLDPSHVESLYAAIRTSGADIASTDHVDVRDDIRPESLSEPIDLDTMTVFPIEDVLPTLFLESQLVPFAYWHRLYRADLSRRATRAPRECFTNSDSAFSLAQFLEARTLAHLNRPTYLYRVRPESTSHAARFDYYSRKTLGGLDAMTHLHRDYRRADLLTLNRKRNVRAAVLAAHTCIHENRTYHDFRRVVKDRDHPEIEQEVRRSLLRATPGYGRPMLAFTWAASPRIYFWFRRAVVSIKRRKQTGSRPAAT